MEICAVKHILSVLPVQDFAYWPCLLDQPTLSCLSFVEQGISDPLRKVTADFAILEVLIEMARILEKLLQSTRGRRFPYALACGLVVAC